MPNFKLTLSKQSRRQLNQRLESARQLGDLRMVTRITAISLIGNGVDYSIVTSTLQISSEAIRLWVLNFLVTGPESLKSKKSPGRKPKLTKTQKRQLKAMIVKGPQNAGYPSACWRSPMIQNLIQEPFGVFYSVHYIAELLKNMGFSYQKAGFVSDHLDRKKRQQWLSEKWPEIIRLAQQKNAYILFGDEASFPQWGTLSYTWALVGHQPMIKTSGKRKAYKVFGLIDYLTGRFFHKGHEGRLNSESYIDFLKGVLRKTQKYIILIQDGAKYHTSKAVNTFFEQSKNRLTVYQLPGYSPDYNPIEKLWKEIKKDGVHLKYFPTFEKLKTEVEDALLRFDNASAKVLSLCGFYQEMSITA